MRCMPFGKKSSAIVPMEISAPYSMIDERVTFNYNSFIPQTVSLPQQSEKQSSTYSPPKYAHRPVTLPTYQWRTPEAWLVSGTDKKASLVTTSNVSNRSPKRWIKMPKGKRRIFRNKGMDDNGDLMPDYDDMNEPDWGVPQPWQKNRKPCTW